MKNQKVAETQAVNVVTGREEKRIGVEIEFFNVFVDSAINALRNAGLQVADYRGYTHATMAQWKITYDASVTSTGTGVGHGLELVSPPLTMEQMEVQLEKALTALNELGAKVDRTCGIHVHHEIDDLNLDHIKNIYRIYSKHQEHISDLMPLSRRGSQSYCGEMKAWEMEAMERTESINDLQCTMSQRYRNINFKSYIKYGTIEFRQHSGSTDFEKIMNWIRITQALVATAKNKKTIKPLSASAKKRATEAFNKEVGLEYTIQGLYSRDRKKELKQAIERRQARRTA